MTRVFDAAVAALPGDLSLASTGAVLAGVLQIDFDWARSGGFVRGIPYPVIFRFMGGKRVIVLLLPTRPLLGLQSVGTALLALRSLPDGLGGARIEGLLLGGSTLQVVFLTPARIGRIVPSPLIHDLNRELIGRGVGYIAAGLIGGLPGAGATRPAGVNIKARGRNRLSGMIHALFSLAVLLGLGKATAHIPIAAPAGIPIKVGVDIRVYPMLEVPQARAPSNLDRSEVFGEEGIQGGCRRAVENDRGLLEPGSARSPDGDGTAADGPAAPKSLLPDRPA